MSRLCRVLAVASFIVTALFSGAVHALNVGDKAPAFTLPSTVGKQASLSDFAGKALVLFFYTGAFTGP